MLVLIACEFSGVVREAFRRKGHDAYSCDLLPPEDDSPFHFMCDVREVIRDFDWDLMIAHPPCTYLTVSGLHWNKKSPERAQKTEEALQFVQELMDAPIDKICIENPVSCISSRIRKPDQIIQPYEFGHDASKRTCLWLKNLQPLRIDPALRVPGRLVEGGKERWSNQTDSGQNKLGPSEDRWKLRSVTYQGIADAMAEVWG
ncbi:putative DNA methylase [Sinorhizobium phage phiM6]|nr:putative DNA methylase [Sinorhizobium phage phiM6]